MCERERETDRQTDRQTDRPADTWVNRQTDRQMIVLQFTAAGKQHGKNYKEIPGCVGSGWILDIRL